MTYRFARSPRWLLGHVVVLALVVSCVQLGLWQLRRLDQRREVNALVEARLGAPEAPLDEVVRPGAPVEDGNDAAYRRVRATGTYAVDQEVLVRIRTLAGRTGAWVVTPLVTAPGRAVLVNRGWVPLEGDPAGSRAAGQPPQGTVTVTGFLRPSDRRGRFGPREDPREGRLAEVVRIDVPRLQAQIPARLYPAYVELQAQAPPQPGELPVPLEPPELDEGPHLGYAGQWFIFATIAAVGWVVILRRTAREHAQEEGRAHRAPPSPNDVAPDPVATAR